MRWEASGWLCREPLLIRSIHLNVAEIIFDFMQFPNSPADRFLVASQTNEHNRTGKVRNTKASVGKSSYTGISEESAAMRETRTEFPALP